MNDIELVSLLQKWADNPKARRYAWEGHPEWIEDRRDYKRVFELGRTFDLLNAAGLLPSVLENSLKNSEYDPPDIQFVWKNGKTVGVEVTEIVDRAHLRAAQTHYFKNPDQPIYDFKIFDEVSYSRAVKERVVTKAMKASWISKFDERWLVMPTGEPDLKFRERGLSIKLDIQSVPFDRVFVIGAGIPNADGDGTKSTAWGEITFGAHT